MNEDSGISSKLDLPSLRNNLIERIDARYASYGISDINAVASQVDQLIAQLASIKSRTVKQGTYLGLTIGDMPKDVIEGLAMLGVTAIFCADPNNLIATNAEELGGLYSYSDFYIKPSAIHVVLNGDQVKSVTIPPISREFPYIRDLQKARTRSEVFGIFKEVLANGVNDPLIERAVANSERVAIGSISEAGWALLKANTEWLVDFRDAFGKRLQITIRFSQSAGLEQFVVVASD